MFMSILVSGLAASVNQHYADKARQAQVSVENFLATPAVGAYAEPYGYCVRVVLAGFAMHSVQNYRAFNLVPLATPAGEGFRVYELGIDGGRVLRECLHAAELDTLEF